MPRKPPAAELEGQIERIAFHDSDTHFVIARFRSASRSGLVTVLGHLPEPGIGETMRLKGFWKDHPRYGPQFQIEQFEVLLPSEVEQIRRYLSSGLIKGIGERVAQRLIGHFGDRTLAVIENEPDRMSEVRGIGAQTAKKIARAWQEHHAVRSLTQFLQTCGIKPLYAARLYQAYGVDALETLKTDPYRVAGDLPRIGFRIADAVVRHAGLPVDECARARACLQHLLESAHEQGHMFVGFDALTQECASAFDLDYHAVQAAMENMAEQDEIRIDRQAPDCPVYPYALYEAETAIAQRIRAMCSLPAPEAPADRSRIARIMETVVRHLVVALSETQQAALECALDKRLVIITGGPGTGKTTLIRAIAAVFDAFGRTFLLTAPTGRAARRMAEVSGRAAVTLHKLLGFNLAEGHFERDADDPLETGAVIVDEASMVDAVLMAGLVKALPLTASLILVGDVSQLPSVGPGTVLGDLIQTGLFETFALQDVFRQDAHSAIIDYAHQVRHGELPVFTPLAPGDALADVTFIEEPEADKIAPIITDLCTRIIPDQLELDGLGDVQVLTPMHKGSAGTLHLNRVLQEAFNHGGQGLPSIGATYKPGDKVMHLRNNYRKEVFNGEIGTVQAVDVEDRRLQVAYDGRTVEYDDADLDELTLAYAISVHKSQGSEYPVIILPLVTQHYVMLQRNLLYTALTRARQMVIVIGSPKAIRIAVQTDQPHQRRSLLAWRLNPDEIV